MAEHFDMGGIPPEPPFVFPPQPKRSRGILINVIVTAVVAVSVMMLLPLIFGSNPIDVLTRKAASQVQEVKTVEERVVQGGQEAVVDAANKVLPSVVNIEVKSAGFGGTSSGIGSGFIYTSDGYIVTNNHVVEDASSIKASLSDGSTYDAKVMGTDADSDLAVIKIAASNLPAATLGTSSDLVVGELAIAVGSPEGFEGSVTSGIISALNRNITISSQESLFDVIQTDSAINPGNSGGPLCNSIGDIIGINTAIYSESGGYDGLGFAIPIDSAKPIIDQLIDKGSVIHAWLGLTGGTLTEDTANRYGLPIKKGAIVQTVYNGAAAQKAGLQAGDIIVSLDGVEIDSMAELAAEVRKHQVGDSVSIDFYRGTDKKQAIATLEQKPTT